MSVYTIKKLLVTLFLIFITASVFSDVVKPALIEINVNQEGQIDVEIRASIEALLTGINGKYKNTKDAPNAAEYDVLRKMPDNKLLVEFDKFKTKFLDSVRLMDGAGDKVALIISKVKIPEPGYTKVPRISVINLKGSVAVSAQSLTWYYPMAFGDNAVRLRQVDKAKEKYHWSEWQWLRNDETSEPLSLTEIVAQKSASQTIINYIVLGFEHIIPKGLDHILFILGLFLFSLAVKPLLWQVTMFTVAHTITLGLAMNGVIALPANVVEPLIALSIAYIGIENIFAKRLQKSRLALVFGFGLLHGLGFASVLADFGLPSYAFTTALISFNVGVELGQLCIIFIAFFLVGFSYRYTNNQLWFKKDITTPISLVITVIALCWFIQRLDISWL